MASFLIDWLGISTSDQARSESLTNRIKSVAEFFSDALRSVEHLDVPRRIAEACPWWVAATGEAVAEVAPPVKFVAELLKSFTEIRDPDKLACLACTTAFQRAAELSFAWVGAPPSPRLGQAWRPYTALTIAESSSFKDLSIESPWNHPFVKSAEQVMMAAAAHAGYDEAGQRRLLHEVRMRFPGELRRLVSHPDTRERYAVVADWFRFEDRENRVRDALRMHADYQRRLFEESPVFGEEPFSLSKIYVDTECGVLTWGEIIRDDETRPTSTTITTYGTEARGKGLLDPFDDEHGGRHDLLQAVMSTIGDLNFRDAIVIQGPAGSGK
jgi:hypothetical protein